MHRGNNGFSFHLIVSSIIWGFPFEKGDMGIFMLAEFPISQNHFPDID
jgi:hypothetical protein